MRTLLSSSSRSRTRPGRTVPRAETCKPPNRLGSPVEALHECRFWFPMRELKGYDASTLPCAMKPRRPTLQFYNPET